MRMSITSAGLQLLLAATPVVLFAQAPPPPPATEARAPRPFVSWWEAPWWNGRAAQALNLTDSQKSDINGIVKDYRSKMMDLRSAMQKADGDVETAFSENPVDQKKAGEAIEKLAAARGDLTRTLSQMSLKMRVLLTADQWQELQKRTPAGRGERLPGRERRQREGNVPPPPAPPSATKQ